MKRGAWWPIGIAGILATTVAANIWVMTIASDDPSFAIEPDYYRKAVAWDSTLAQARESARLGWHLTPSLTPIDARGGARLSTRLVDSTGVPIPGATIHVSARHVARANDVHDMTLTSSGDGEYAGVLDARRPGQWELRFDVRAGSAHFTEVARVELGVIQSEAPKARSRGIAVIPSGGAERRSRGIAVFPTERPSTGTMAIPRLASLARNDTIAIPRLRMRFARASLGMTTGSTSHVWRRATLVATA